MQSILTVTTPASSYDLTELADVKDELNITNGASDVTLARYISGASTAATQYCNRVFVAETLSETFLLDHMDRFIRSRVKPLQLARYPLITVLSVIENGILLVENTDYLVDKTMGQLTRIDSNGLPIFWNSLPLVVAYSAGFATIPGDVEDAVIRMVSKRYVAKGRDPALKQENIPGVREVQYWISTGADSGNMTPDITDLLDNYRVIVCV